VSLALSFPVIVLSDGARGLIQGMEGGERRKGEKGKEG